MVEDGHDVALEQEYSVGAGLPFSFWMMREPSQREGVYKRALIKSGCCLKRFNRGGCLFICKFLLLKITFLVFSLCVYACMLCIHKSGRVNAMAILWRPEDNLQELVLSFPLWVLGIQHTLQSDCSLSCLTSHHSLNLCKCWGMESKGGATRTNCRF